MKSQVLWKQKWIPIQPVVPPNKGDKSPPKADGYFYSLFRVLTGDLDIWKGYSVQNGYQITMNAFNWNEHLSNEATDFCLCGVASEG